MSGDSTNPPAKVDGRKTGAFREKMRQIWANDPARRQRWLIQRRKRGPVNSAGGKITSVPCNVDPDFDEGF